MKCNYLKIACLTAVALTTISLTSCKDDNKNDDADDSKAAAVAEQFVDHTVAPTYTALASATEELADMMSALRANPTQNALNAACEKFLEARAWWEKSEAFLFGAAGDFGIDPHIDSWPLDADAFDRLMGSTNLLELLDDEDGDQVAGEQLGNALLGFHGIEYILFENGQPKQVANISANEWIYAVAVSGDLRNRCYQLEVGWLGDKAPQSHIDKLDDLELAYTVAGGDNSYGDNMKKAGQAGSTYATRAAGIMAIVQGCADIADEVGSSKIYSAWHGDDVSYIESPYSQKSIVDFTNNVISIQNVWMGGIEGQRNSGKSVSEYIKGIDSGLEAKVQTCIQNALDKIAAMPAPFVNNISDPRNGEAVDACGELSDVLGEVIDAIRNN